MPKNILILNGSPRRGGNTDSLVEAFKKGCATAGHSVETFVVTSDPIQGCRACDQCWSKGEACIFDDGLRRLSPMLERADVLVQATPFYYFSYSAQIKAALDKMYPYISPNRKADLKIKECILLLCEGAEEKEDCDGLLQSFDTMCKYLEWKNAGVVIANGVLAKGDIKGHPALGEAEKLAAGL